MTEVILQWPSIRPIAAVKRPDHAEGLPKLGLYFSHKSYSSCSSPEHPGLVSFPCASQAGHRVPLGLHPGSDPCPLSSSSRGVRPLFGPSAAPSIFLRISLRPAGARCAGGSIVHDGDGQPRRGFFAAAPAMPAPLRSDSQFQSEVPCLRRVRKVASVWQLNDIGEIRSL